MDQTIINKNVEFKYYLHNVFKTTHRIQALVLQTQ